ncbi:hypothetical protein CW304_00625 [Bacillus sp. UFRGS-B20]|nr:hypothetical protein CW304_00625 [Bacillus sp. UFRGS-B20]
MLHDNIIFVNGHKNTHIYTIMPSVKVQLLYKKIFVNAKRTKQEFVYAFSEETASVVLIDF